MKIDVLDKGYVRYDKHMGSDLDVVNSAKVSFDRASATFEEKEARLLAFLVRDGHTSTFRHSAVTLEVYAPLITARQWWKYAVASAHVEDQLGWNESSRRYITETPEFYLVAPDEWRSVPENKKQGSGPTIESLSAEDWEKGNREFFSWNPEDGHYQPPNIDDVLAWQMQYGNYWTKQLAGMYSAGLHYYDQAIERGIAPEQARLFLPAYGLYVRWRWTFSLGAGLHFLHQRLAHDAQSEIRSYAEAVRDILKIHFPKSVEATLELV